MIGKIKRRSLRCGGRPKADFGSLFTSVIAPDFNAAGSIADESINNNKTITNGIVNNNTTIPSDPTKTPTMSLVGAGIGAATGIVGSLFGNRARKREMRRQQSIKDWQDTTQEAANMTSVLNNSRDYQEDYLRQFRTAAKLGKTLGAKGIYITDGGDATKIGNNTYLLRGGSHEDVNETGQTGIGINVGGNEIEAEGGEVAQKKNGALRIFSAQPILGNSMSPAQAILRGYNKDSVFSQQQAFKKRNGLNDDGSAKYGFGGDIRSNRSPIDNIAALATAYQKLNTNSNYNKQKGKFKGGTFRGAGSGGTWTNDYKSNKGFDNFNDAYDDAVEHNGGNVLGNGEVTVTAKRIKPTFMKSNNNGMNIINYPANETPYIPQRHNRSRTIFSSGDYLGLGIDTLAALSTGLVNYNTAGKYTLPDRAPIIQASKLPTTYNVNPEIEEVKRYRDKLTGQTFNNTSSSVAALNRSSAINLDALSNLSKLWTTKENEENKMLTEDAKNQQTVAAQNVQNELARQSEIARIKNEAIQAKGDALNVGLSGLSQAWTNFWTAGRTAYEDDQARRAMVASSKDATPTRLIEMGYDLSPDLVASLYRTAKDDRTKRFYLSRLSSAQRQKYGIN